MTDVDDLLRTDAAQWRAGEAPFPSLDHLAATAVGVAAGRRTRRWAVLGSAAAVVVVASAAVAIGVQHGGDRRPAGSVAGQSSTPDRSSTATHMPAPPSSITVGGKQVPYAGAVPWSGAVADPSDPRTVVVQADGDAIHAKDACGVPSRRVVLEQTSTTVRVLVAGYLRPLRPGAACAEVGHVPQPQRVTLSAPLAGRRLVDVADGRTHVVLDPATVPTFAGPTGECGAQPVTWDEQADVAMRSCTVDAVTRVVDAQLFAGPSGAYARDRGTPAGTRSGPYDVRGARATAWHYVDQDNDLWTLEWSPRSGRQLVLVVPGGAGTGKTLSQVLTFARSVR